MNTPPECPLCAGTGEPLGLLGCLRWFRCRRCGISFHHKAATRSKIMKNTSHKKEGDTNGPIFGGKPENSG